MHITLVLFVFKIAKPAADHHLPHIAEKMTIVVVICHSFARMKETFYNRIISVEHDVVY